jgi:2-C-methyl-D-erythritol 4-phosphate cytidylyltransferase
VVAAGSGTRYGGPKQVDPLLGSTVVAHSVATARSVCDGVVVVVPASGSPVPIEADVIVPGGDSRSESVRCGLRALPVDVEIVLIHDAARPGASAAVFKAVEAAVHAGADGAVPALAVTDTLKSATLGSYGLEVAKTISRSDLYAIQTPQAFRRDVLEAAHAGGGDATDDAGLVEQSGGSVVVVEGERRALKLTEPEDLVMLQALLLGTEIDGRS